MVEARALSRHVASLGNVGQSRWRGVCPVSLEGDRRSGRDQYVRGRWSRSETVACLIHRVCLRFSRMKCFTRYDFRFEYRDGLAELICSGCLAPVACTAGTFFEVRHADLPIATMEATDDAEKGRSGLRLGATLRTGRVKRRPLHIRAQWRIRPSRCASSSRWRTDDGRHLRPSCAGRSPNLIHLAGNIAQRKAGISDSNRRDELHQVIFGYSPRRASQEVRFGQVLADHTMHGAAKPLHCPVTDATIKDPRDIVPAVFRAKLLHGWQPGLGRRDQLVEIEFLPSL